MTGHFEGGMWIEDSKSPKEPMTVEVKVAVDDSEVKSLIQTMREFSKTNMRICLAFSCDNNWRHTKNPALCNCREIEINEAGQCMNYRKRG